MLFSILINYLEKKVSRIKFADKLIMVIKVKDDYKDVHVHKDVKILTE